MTLTELATLKHGPCTVDPSAKTATQLLRESGLFSVEEMQAFEARERFGLEKYGASVREGWDGAEVAALQEAMDLAVYCAASPRLRFLLKDIEFMLTDIRQAIAEKHTIADIRQAIAEKHTIADIRQAIAEQQKAATNPPILAPCRGA